MPRYRAEIDAIVEELYENYVTKIFNKNLKNL
jgi:hypothetical protein